MIAVWVALAGSAGACARFWLDGLWRSHRPSVFPWPTVAINVSGSLLLGVVAGLVLFHGSPGALRTIVGTGFCGGYTTFSTASFETVRLAQQGKHAMAAANALVTLLLTVAAGAAGLLIATS